MNGSYEGVALAEWKLRIRDPSRVEHVKEQIRRASAESQYGWGHTIDFGSFVQEGFLGNTWLAVVEALDRSKLWPDDLSGLHVADVGACTGGISAVIATRGAALVYAVDELPGHAQQARVVAEAFELDNMHVVEASLYELETHIEPATLDLVLFSGVLYHLSDMLVGLYALGRLLKPGGLLVVETNAVEDMQHSYANFGRYYAGMWWQPTMLCVKDMMEFMGFERVRLEPFVESRCIAAGTKVTGDIPFKRGMNWPFASREDAAPRSLDWRVMAPAPSVPVSPIAVRLGPAQRLVKRLFRIP